MLNLITFVAPAIIAVNGISLIYLEIMDYLDSKNKKDQTKNLE